MNKTFVGILIGLLIGAGATWVILHRDGGAGSVKPEATAAKSEEKENPLRLPPAKRAAAGIALVKPAEIVLAPEVPVFGRVLDPTPLVTVIAELETAQAAGNASQKELERAQKLFAADGNASAQAVEMAEAAATRDRAAVASARARLLAAWGGDIAQNFETISRELAAGAALARLDALPGEPVPAAPKQARLSLPGGTETFTADVLGVAPVADPQVQGASFLVLLHGHPLPAGAALRGTIPGAGEAAKQLVIPRSAVVYHHGSAWVFVLGEEDTFERKLVQLGSSVSEDRVAVTQGLDADEQVVTAGAQQLLAAELQAGGAPAEE